MATWLEKSRSPEYSPAKLSQTLAEVEAVIGISELDEAMAHETIIIGGYLNTHLIKAKSILAEHLDVNSLSAISANIGEVTSGTLRGNGTDGSYFYITTPDSSYNSLLAAVDSNGAWITRITKEGVLQAQGADIAGSITSSTITSSTITGTTITGGIIRTSTSGTRIQISDDMLRAYASGKERIMLHATGLMFNDDTGAYAGSISGNYSGLVLGGDIIWLIGDTKVTGWLQPVFNNESDIGSANYRWRTIYLQNNPNVASDIRLKSSIQNIPNELIGELKEIQPKMYQQGEKWHFGYIAQDVERALYKYALKKVGWDKAKDYVKDFELLYKNESYLSLIYAEIAVLKEAEMQARIDELEARLLDLEQAS